MKVLVAFLIAANCSYALAEIPGYIRSCMDCHGENGVSMEADMPTIAGASATYLEDTMIAYLDDARPAIESTYRAGDTKRPTTDMKKLTQALTEAQIKEVAIFFAKQPFKAAQQPFDAALAATGEKIHNSQCKKCHENGGSEPEDDAGILAGQWTAYLRETMVHYMDGSREQPKNMKKKVDKLSDKELEALLHYYASQQ